MVDACTHEYVFAATQVDAFLTREVTYEGAIEHIYLLCSPGGAQGHVTYVGILKRKYMQGHALFLLCERSTVSDIRAEMTFLGDVLTATKVLHPDCAITLVVEDSMYKDAVHYADYLRNDDSLEVMLLHTTAKETDRRMKYMQYALASEMLAVESEGQFIATYPETVAVSRRREAREYMLLQLRAVLKQFMKMSHSVGCAVNYRMSHTASGAKRVASNEDLAHLFLGLATVMAIVERTGGGSEGGGDKQD